MILLSTNLPIKLFKKGKVRDIYDLGDKLLIVSTDRISAFDVVMENGIPGKGKILNKLSKFWFTFTKDIVENHLITTDFDEILLYANEIKNYREILEDRIMLVKKTTPIPIECIVRGYLAGSAYKEYKKSNSICGIKLPNGLKEKDKLPYTIFTPSTKAITGHDENITHEEAKKLIGEDVFNKIKELSIKIYEKANTYAENRGIIIADTKFEFGFHNEKIILIDELLTPDSSRFWEKEKKISFDKQFVRDYLEKINWDKETPITLPQEIVYKTYQKYSEAMSRLVDECNYQMYIDNHFL